MDLLLDDTGDLVIRNGDLVLIDGAEEIAQRLRIRLRLFVGEWFLAPAEGMPYFDRILGQKVSRATLLSILREQILACPGVEEITSLDAQVDGERRSVSVFFRVTTTDGDPVELTTEVP